MNAVLLINLLINLITSMCVSVCIFMSFTVFYCTPCFAFFSLFYLYCLSVCLYVSCLCLWALLPDLNKMMMMMMMINPVSARLLRACVRRRPVGWWCGP